jgi:hypothetical protein
VIHAQHSLQRDLHAETTRKCASRRKAHPLSCFEELAIARGARFRLFVYARKSKGLNRIKMIERSAISKE